MVLMNAFFSKKKIIKKNKMVLIQNCKYVNELKILVSKESDPNNPNQNILGT